MRIIKCVFYFLLTAWMATSVLAQDQTYENSHYLFPEFREGTIIMKTGIKNVVQLNYNRGTEEMLFIKNGTKLAIAQDNLKNVAMVLIGDRKMIVVDMKFVEVLDHEEWQLFVEHRCKVRETGRAAGFGTTSETSAIKSHSSLSAIGGLYELELPTRFKIEPYTQYWLGRNDRIKKFVNLKSLKKMYKGKSSLFKAYLEEHEVEYSDLKSVIQLISYMEAS